MLDVMVSQKQKNKIHSRTEKHILTLINLFLKQSIIYFTLFKTLLGNLSVPSLLPCLPFRIGQSMFSLS